MSTVQSSIATGIDAVYYLTQDFDRARSFYENVLGLHASWEDRGDDAAWVEYELPDGATFGLGYMKGREFAPSGGVMFAVPDVKETLERAKAAGATPVFEFLETPVCYMSWCIDPEGNRFCIHHRKSS
jgi:predicted enzyme related to lactoylglutathione lyase